MKRWFYAGVVLASMLAVVGWMGCGGKSDSGDTTLSPTGTVDNGQQQDNEMMAMCPMGVAGTQVAYQEAPDGAALVFTTEPAGVAELRRRTAGMVDMFNMHQGGGTGDMGGMHGSGRDMGGGGAGGDHGMMGGGNMSGCLMMAVPSQASYAEVDGGARVVLTPTDPGQLSQLRTEIQAHATRMAAGECPMMKAGSGCGQGTDTGTGGSGGGVRT